MAKGQTREVEVLVTVKEERMEKSTLQLSFDSPRASSAIFVALFVPTPTYQMDLGTSRQVGLL